MSDLKAKTKIKYAKGETQNQKMAIIRLSFLVKSKADVCNYNITNIKMRIQIKAQVPTEILFYQLNEVHLVVHLNVLLINFE